MPTNPNMDALSGLETGLKIARLISSAEIEDMITACSDVMNILRILTGAPYGATLPQIASLNNCQDEAYTRGLLNLLVKGGVINESEGLYTLTALSA